MQKIPLVDLAIQHRELEHDLLQAFQSCLRQQSFIMGPDHGAFATEFSHFCGGGHITLCANGTDALTLAIREHVGAGSGMEEIITVANTFIATSEAISLANYQPVFVDIDPQSYTMDVARLEEAITDRTRAVIPVHLYGQMANMEAIMQVADKYGLVVIEDAAQAHGSQWQGKGPGHWGRAATFSFYPGKNLGALGDAGAILSQDEAVAARLSMRANHGRKEKYEHAFEGTNSRLDGLQAAFLRKKLPFLKKWTEARRQVANWYREELGDVPEICLPFENAQGKHVYHLFVAQVATGRDELVQTLNARGIGASVHYPIPLHRQPAYRDKKIIHPLSVTDDVSGKIFSLPMFPELTREQVQFIAGTLKEILAGRMVSNFQRETVSC